MIQDADGRSLLQRLDEALQPPAREALRACIEACEARSQSLFLVGGAVRDLLLGRSNVDLDLTTEGETAPVAQALAERLGGRAVAHQRFDTASVRGPGYHLDLARTRRETYARPGALPDVQPDTIEGDLQRRDFTINAMALRLTQPEGELIDPFDGRRDLQRRLLRVLHEASFRDDATRMLRGLRYLARLDLRFEAATEGWLRRDLHALAPISGPRLRRELVLLFEEPNAPYGVEAGQSLGVLQTIHPSLHVSRAVAERWREALAGPHPADAAELGFCLLASPRDEETVASLSERLHLVGRFEAALRDFVRLGGLFAKLAMQAGDAAAVVEMLEHLSPAAIWAASIVEEGPAAAACRVYLTDLRRVKPLLRGDDLLALGVPPGEAVGAMLSHLRRERLRGRITTREDEIELVRRRPTGGGS